MKDHKLLLVAVLCVVLLAIVDDAEAGKKKRDRAERQERRQNRQEQRENQEQELTEAGWVFGECQPRRGSCGRGTKTGTKDGEPDKTVRCVVPCSEGEGGRRGGGRQRRPNRQRGDGCKYTRGEWSECDASSNTMSRTLTLKKGGDDCEQTKTVSRPCFRKGKRATGQKCKYERRKDVEWSACDTTSNTQTKTLNLRKGPSTCEATKQFTRKCRGCRYVKGDWGECVDGKRSLTMTLSRKSDPATCEASKTISRPCTGANGKAKCFYGQWTKFGECNNGVKTKTRPVIDGGERCQKRAVKTKPC